MPYKRLLVIDESPDARAPIADALRERGLDAREASTPAEADAALAEGPDLVFTEMLGGAERVVAAMQRFPEAAFVVVTSEPPGSALVRRAVRIGAVAVLHKPVRAEDVRRVLDDLDADAADLVQLRP